MQTPLIPRQPVPDLTATLLGGGTWSLAQQRPASFTMVVFYRGFHCPICSRYLADLNRKLPDFTEQGVQVIALSGDPQERATQAKTDWNLDALPIGYGVPLATARQWGLYVSTSRGTTSTGVMEPDLFAEPGLFLVRPDRTLYAASVQSMPFARPAFADVLSAVQFVRANDYPARGEVVG